MFNPNFSNIYFHLSVRQSKKIDALISQYQQNFRIKTHYSIKHQEPNIIDALIDFVIPRLKRDYGYIIETRKPNKIQKFNLRMKKMKEN